MESVDTLFITILKTHLNDIRSGALPKGKFLGKYMAALKEVAGNDAFRYKNPQVIGNGKEPDNNWLDYVINLPADEFEWFKEALFS